MRGRVVCPAALAILLVVQGCGGGRAVEGHPPGGDDGPYRVYVDSPKLATRQWIGEPGVDAAVILAVDDLGPDVGRHDTYLRPILDRLRAIDGRSPLSVMACRTDVDSPILKRWVAEGVSVEVHTLDHPCPIWVDGRLDRAAATTLGGVDLLQRIPGNRPVAFRMPYCDSRNNVSPRFFEQILEATSPEGHFLTIDSSVIQLFTPDDPALPRDRVLDANGRERFRKYLPSAGFRNLVENYPYPYVVGRIWEFPAIAPSDWEAQRANGPNSPRTVDDLKAALDLTVAKGGVFTWIFHPHGWIESREVVELIDHAAKVHGGRVKFLSFREAQERIDRNLLVGQPLRSPRGADNGVRLIDLDADATLDVVIGNGPTRRTRLWDQAASRWVDSTFPTTIVDPVGGDSGVRFGRIGGSAVAIVRAESARGGWRFEGGRWAEDPRLLSGLEVDGRPVATRQGGCDRGVRFVDLDGDGRDELVVANSLQAGIFRFDERSGWRPSRESRLPDDARVVDREGRDAGLRFVDLDGDGSLDLLVANEQGSGAYLHEPASGRWRRVLDARPGDPRGLPPLVRGGRDNGGWFQGRALVVQNEDTAGKGELVEVRAFDEILKDVPTGPKSPEAALRTIRAAPGFRVELAAAEPLVRDPIAFDWGADGRLWVVEMGDYPLGLDGKGAAGGSIRVLEDKDGDGRYDSSTTFLDRLGFPTGVMPWRGGVLVSRAPDILFAEDLDGDGRADRVEALFTGFVPGNPQHRVNGFDLGLDGLVYGANGDSGGTIRAPGRPGSTSIRGRDFRFDPDSRRFEAESGQAQFGRHRDDWGRWFGNNNSVWAWHYVLPEHALSRNPRLALASPRQPLDPDPGLHPDSRTLPRFNNPGSANKVTSANSPTPYRDDLFGPAYASSLFVSEPVHNLVRRMTLAPSGVTFAGSPALDDAGREFLASTDPWFRPTMLRTGPDGALWVADMYRAVIEHPEWIPDDQEAKIDLRAGDDRGRIYRVVPVGARRRPIPRLDRLDTPGLVAALEGPGGWQRDTAQRLLAHRRDPAAVPPLRALARSSPGPKARVQALWTLRSLGGLDAPTIAGALVDAHPQVRRAGVEVAGLEKAFDPSTLDLLVGRVDDPDPEVRFALALALGESADPRAGRALGRLAVRDGEDPWARAAILSSAVPHAGAILAGLFEGAGPGGPAPAWVEPLIALAASAPGGLAPLVESIGTPRDGAYSPWQFSAAAGLAAEADRGRSPELAAAFGRWVGLVAAARAEADDDRLPEGRRVVAARVLGRAQGDRAVLAGLLRPQVPAAVQAAALRSITRLDDRRSADAILGGWPGYSPGVRGMVLDALLGRPAWTAALLSALEDTCVPAAEVPVAIRRRLLDQPDPDLRRRASAIFDRAAATPRREVVDAYRPALATPGDPRAGALVFRRACATCHKLDGAGVEVGPDLAALADASPEALLVAILDPNRAFEARYADYSVHTTDGRVLSGMIAAESANALTLRRQDGREDVLLRSEVEAVAASGRSLMPEGLEKEFDARALADLLAYLGSARGVPRGEGR